MQADESLSALSDDDYGNFVTIDEADDLACNHSMHACMADMGGDGAPNDDEDGPGAPTTDTGAGQTANVAFGAESSHRKEHSASSSPEPAAQLRS